MSTKYYAIAQGRKTGIFTTWPQARQQVDGFPNAIYKSFKTMQEAQAFLKNPSYRPGAGKTGSGKNKTKNPGKDCHNSDLDDYPDNAIIVYTDGGAIGNPGPGGYGVVIKGQKELSGGYNLTTNNRMELKAVMAALEELENSSAPIVVHSDSKYVINALNKGWAKNWKKKKLEKSDNNPALNSDMWAILVDLAEHLDVTFKWVKGHAGDPLNERCDVLANNNARKKDLPDDTGYLTSQKTDPNLA